MANEFNRYDRHVAWRKDKVDMIIRVGPGPASAIDKLRPIPPGVLGPDFVVYETEVSEEVIQAEEVGGEFYDALQDLSLSDNSQPGTPPPESPPPEEDDFDPTMLGGSLRAS